jgi:hypothetical protein
LPANRVLQDKIGYLLKRPAGQPPHEVRRYYASFSCQAQSWKKPRRVVATVEWHPGEFYPRVGFIVTTLARPAERVVAFYNQRGTAEQWIKEGKGAIKWTRPSCRTFAANAVRLQLHALEVAVPRQNVPGNPVADRPVAGAARASIRSATIRCDKRRQQKCASTQAKLRVSAPRRSLLIGSTLAAHAVRDLPLPTIGEGAILGPATTPNPGNVG